MSTEVLLATAAAVVSLYAALFHAWIFALHRQAHDHAWAALTGAGACCVSFGTALLFASDPAAMLRAQQIQGAGAALVTLGAVGFSATRLGQPVPQLRRAAAIVCGAALAFVAFAPELTFALDRPPRTTLAGGVAYLQYELSSFGALTLGGILAFFFAPLVLCLHGVRARRPGARSLLACIALWTCAGLLDTATGLGLLDLPFLMPTGGYMALAVAFSAMLVRDLVLARDASEQLGARLEGEVRARSDALRAIDLRLARGEQLAAIGTLAAGVAHEINNPLAYVSANLNQLRALWEDASESEAADDEVKEILGECREGIGRVGTIVSDLLRMARQGESESESCDLGEVARAVLPLIVREAGGSIEIVTEIESPLPVRGNARLLRQAALNLALNALHAVPDAPRRAPRVVLSARAAHGYAELCVRDNGPGIPPEVLGQIFEPSFTTKSEGSGTGLGLALTRLVVTRHRGAIDVQSDSDGTAVTLRIPLASAGSAAQRVPLPA
ncbi:MAG: hypothetical protein DCC71_21120 [Proteobacteria bacterium]|nr:MAG: hypothetical protein DCC71_21120 [Pseudomonadota bacterium]